VTEPAQPPPLPRCDFDGEWTVRGPVDSQDSFGPMMPSRWICQVRHAGGTTSQIDVQLIEGAG